MHARQEMLTRRRRPPAHRPAHQPRSPHQPHGVHVCGYALTNTDHRARRIVWVQSSGWACVGRWAPACVGVLDCVRWSLVEGGWLTVLRGVMPAASLCCIHFVALHAVPALLHVSSAHTVSCCQVVEGQDCLSGTCMKHCGGLLQDEKEPTPYHLQSPACV